MAITKPDMTRIWAAGANPADIVDPDIVPGGGKFDLGWLAEKPGFENFNFVENLITTALAYINEQGIPEWDTGTTYPVDAITKGSDGELYTAISEQAGNDPISTPASWRHGTLDAIPAGTSMLFTQAAAPVGWTKDATPNLFHALQITSGTGGTIGGSIAFSNFFKSSLATNTHALTISEMPAHSHGGGDHGHVIDTAVDDTGAGLAANGGTSAPSNMSTFGSGTIINTEGGGSGHSHTIGTDVLYMTAIICIKD